MTKIGYIYLLTSPSGKHYVGQTWYLNKRIEFYKYAICKTQPKIFRALKKYGFENFIFEILDICYEQEELNDAEIYWGLFYNTLKNGYNCRLGGQNGMWSEEMKIKLSLAHKKGKDHHRFGKKKLRKNKNKE